MTIKTSLVILAALTSAAAVGCAAGGTSSTDPSASGDQTKASLHRAKGCDDLLGDLKADAKWKIDHAINYQIQGIKACQSHYPDAQCAGYGGYVGYGPTRGVDDSFGGGAVPISSPTAGSSGSSGNTSSSSSSGGSSSGGTGALPPGDSNAESGGKGASSYSETNTQVKGVDEADIVKNDGSNIYLLHGRAFKVVHAFPANEMKESGTINIDGQPNEMFVADGKVVIYSSVNGANILTEAGVKPRAQYTDYGFGPIAYAGSDTGTKGGVAVEPGTSSLQTYVPLTKVTVLTLNGDTPVVTRESWFEGSYLDSRRVGTSVRTVYQGNAYGPQLKYGIYDLIPPSTCNGGGSSTPGYDPGTGSTTSSGGSGATTPPPDDKPETCVDNYPKTGNETIGWLEKLRTTNHGLIDASVLGDWLPYSFVRANGATTASTTACQDFYVPTIGSTESGITEVSTIDLGDPSGTPRETAILGRADTVYGNADSLYVASRAYVEPPFVWYDPWGGGGGSSSGWSGSSGGSGSVEPVPEPAPAVDGGAAPIGTKSLHLNADQASATVQAWSSDKTHLHKFEFKTDAKFANYQASGTVRGTVKDQFSLDEKDGYLRIATTESRGYYTADYTYVQADSAVPEKGAPPPARPQTVSHVFVLGQQGSSLGTQGDVGDLAPNERIYSVRFVENRGYVVTFRQVDPLFVLDLQVPQKPAVLGELTIPGFSEYMHPLDAGHLLTIGRGENRQLALKMFDVTNGSSPKEIFNLTYNGDDYASSDAEYDHKAFTYFADKQLLAIPVYSYNYNNGVGGPHSSLDIFHVDIQAGIQHLGDIDGSSLVSKFQNGYCNYYGPSVRRGLFLDNTVYAITYGGIAAKDVGNLAAAPTTFSLPLPETNDYYSGAPIACSGVPGDSGGKPIQE